MWVYSQSTGELSYNGRHVETGYSGRMTNKNNPSRQQVKGLGPIPQGTYRIGIHTRSKGPLTIILTQVSGESFGRSEFRIHGERVKGPSGWASEGCIVVGLGTRREIVNSADKVLVVVP